MSVYMGWDGMVVDATDKPIGYWLKHLHNLIEAQFDATLADLGLGRRQWQVLNMLSGLAQTRAEVERGLAPFWQDAGPQLDAILDGPDGLVTRRWVADDAAGDALVLTEQGRTGHRSVAGRVGETRATVLQGLTTQQYTDTVRILSVMAGNIESALAKPAAGPGQSDPAAPNAAHGGKQSGTTLD
jgi:hypothetical protein